MNKIKILPESVINKIAAGEVIERPASVLKELIENSIDAGAKTINVDIEKAGKGLIRVNDDGSGLSPADLELAVKRHSTSKITDFSDLDKLATFGFRGEALYSISAVSKMIIKSSTADALSGSEIYVEGGNIKRVLPAGPVGGTTVEIKDLFFNTPARKKFLKSDSTEKSRMLKVIEESALINTATAFNVRCDGKEVYSLPAQTQDVRTNLLNRVRAVLGKEIADKLIFVKDDFADFKGFIGVVNRFSTSKSMQFFFVNKRPVTSTILRQALYRALSSYTDKNARVVSIIFLNLAPDSFDVNIHPQKKEVRFKDEGLIFSVISKLAAQALGQNLAENTPQNKAVYYIQDKKRSVAKDLERKLKEEKENSASDDNAFLNIDNFVAVEEKSDAKSETFSSPQNGAKPSGAVHLKDGEIFTPFYRFLNQVSQSYLLFETKDGVLFVDQHAAQERILFEEYLAQLEGSKPAVQKFIVPVNVEMAASGIENIMQWKTWLADAGFEIERFGPTTIMLHSAPEVFGFDDNTIKEFVLTLAENMKNAADETEDIKRQKVARLACKKSVKANETVTSREAVEILKKLHECKHPNICPHGRPATFSFSKGEISKKFSRSKVL